MLNALLHADRSQGWVDRDGATQVELVAIAHEIAATLAPSGGRVVLSCRHARFFVPGLLGAWLAGFTVELLPNVQPATLDRVDADGEVAYVLHDDDTRQDRSAKAIYVPAIVSARAGRSESARPDDRRLPPWPTIAIQMTTSGTTELPRSVTKSMAQLLAELDVLAMVIPDARCVLSTVPLSHLYGLLFGALLPLGFGARIVSHDALLPADLAAIIERESVDLVISTPAHLRAMAGVTMPRELRVVSSGARLPAELHMSLVTEHAWKLTDVLGSTETGGIATRTHPMHAWAPLPSVKVSAPDGQLVVESPWSGGRVELDDRIAMRPGGTFQYLGRNTELVKIAGKRAHAHAIEAAVLAVPGISDVALVVHAAIGKEPRVALAYSVVPGAAPPARDDITAAVRKDFDAVFTPKIIKLVDRVPRTDRGKVDAGALRALLGLDSLPTTNRIAVRRVAPGEYLADIPRDLVFLRGHFDAFSILPGAVLIERVVWPIVQTELPAIRTLRGIRRLRFRRPVFPDQQLAVTVKHVDRKVTFEVACVSAIVASGQLLVE